MTLAQKKALQTIVESGKKVWTVAYNPTMMSQTTPPPNSSVFHTNNTANLIEIIYVEN